MSKLQFEIPDALKIELDFMVQKSPFKSRNELAKVILLSVVRSCLVKERNYRKKAGQEITEDSGISLRIDSITIKLKQLQKKRKSQN